MIKDYPIIRHEDWASQHEQALDPYPMASARWLLKRQADRMAPDAWTYSATISACRSQWQRSEALAARTRQISGEHGSSVTFLFWIHKNHPKNGDLINH